MAQVTRIISAALALAMLAASPALAGPREQAKRIHDRLVGIPPSPQKLLEMETLITNDPIDGPIDAALEAMEDPVFYSSSLKNFVTPRTNVDQTVFGPLNDYSALVIGMIRDDEPFNTVLSADLVYVGANGVVPQNYSHTDNEHYEALERNRIDLSNPALFVPREQSTLPGSQLAASEAAGVITTRAAGEAFFSAGTNRRMWRFTSMNYLCRDLEDMKDITRPADRVRQDVTRSPGGDSQLFHNHCVGCHSGMDPMAGAYAYFEWDADAERVVHTRGEVSDKHLINDNVFPGGYITTDNRWDNFWRTGPNWILGWRAGTGGGFGAKTLGEEVAGSRAFSVCQVEKVFEHVCFRPVGSDEDRTEVERVADVFENSDYSMKQVFAETAVYCSDQ